MSLREYRRKRDFRHTHEPIGDEARSESRRSFVVQKHAARRLHYDFRLEWNGVLKSWAVPKGPSMDPAVRSLAIAVEDHPVEYARFEGIIPQGQYGGGTVMVWDEGHWEPQGDPEAGLRSGRLKFHLHGTRLRGNWTLVRMKERGDSSDSNQWLLIKQQDEQANADAPPMTETCSTSVLTNRTMTEIAQDADRVWSGTEKQSDGAASDEAASDGARDSGEDMPDVSNLVHSAKTPLPEDPRPQLATAADRVPEGQDWLHELKFDGYRLLAIVDGSNVRLITRRGNDWTDRFPAVAEAIGRLELKNGILDGELVALNRDGVSDFQQLQNWMKRGRDQQLTYYIFDVPYANGYNLQRCRLIERKDWLQRFLLSRNAANDGIVRFSDHIRGHGQHVFTESCRSALEGVISKHVDSPYEPRRTRNWLKLKCQGRQEFVVGGYTRPHGKRKHLGALLVGYRDEDKWIYCGRVGTGFTHETLKDLGRRLKELRRDSPPFDNPPTGTAARELSWVDPVLVVEVEFSEWTNDGRLRHPSFQGLREDKAAREVVREHGLARSGSPRNTLASESKGEGMSTTFAGITITSPDRVVYPDADLTKWDLADYYAAVTDWILPHLVDRPLTLVRCPQGRQRKCFYQKHWADGFPDAVGSVMIEEKHGTEPYVVIGDAAGLMSLVQMNVLEMHPWGARVDRLERPDVIVFDLDPHEDVPWPRVVDAAVDIRDTLREAGLESFVRTSGGKGLHVVVPLTRRSSWDEVHNFAKQISTGLAIQRPADYVANMRKSLRRGRIFIDFHRNRRGATSVASYSTRARHGAPVAAPMTWSELPEISAANQWTVTNLPARLRELGSDPWADYFDLRQSITKQAAAFARRIS